jgi:hypothetical protein
MRVIEMRRHWLHLTLALTLAAAAPALQLRDRTPPQIDFARWA